MRSLPFSVRSLAVTCVATAALVAAACSDSEEPEPIAVTSMRLSIGQQRAPYTGFTPGGNNVAVLTALGFAAGLDTQVTVAWLRADGSVEKNAKPALGYRAVIDSIEVRSQGLYVTARNFDAFGFTFRAMQALPAEGVAVNFRLLDPDGQSIFGPVKVMIKTP
jgi:hypothetical protein